MKKKYRMAGGLSLAVLAFSLLANTAYAQQASVMQGRIWDFSSAHPDFEKNMGGPVVTGQVAPELGPDGRPVWSGAQGRGFSSEQAFNEWYRDVPGVNMSKPYAIELKETPPGSGNYAFDGNDFFPIDNELLGNEGDKFRDGKKQPRNFHYTMQLAGEFSFQNDTDEFTFSGDDDLWVFFGGKLGIDLGGIHSSATAKITGAQLRALGLQPNQSYPIDIFFAERQTTGSNFNIKTNFNIQPPAPERVPGGEEAAGHLTLPLPLGTELVRGQRYWSPSGEYFLTLNPDGNLVVARADGGYVWGFDTQSVDFPRVGSVVWQEDGNLAAYAADGSYIWSALHENPDPSAQLVLRPNGALQIATPDRVLWSSIPYEPEAVAAAESMPPLPQTNTGEIALAWAQSEDEAPAGTRVAFVSTDGSAAVGSRTVFILHNEATGEATLVPVSGDDETTGTIVELAPGTYTIESPAPSIGQFSTFLVSQVSDTRITVPEAADSSEPAVTVSFSIETQRVAVAMLVDEVTGTSVSLVWGPQPDVEVAEYVLVRTDGTTPADNPAAGTPVPLDAPTAQTALAQGLEPNRTYTFTLFSTSTSGEALPVRTYTASTATPGERDAAYAVAPNTILPTDFAALNAQRVGETWVRVQLDPARLERGSSSEMAGLEANTTLGGGCVVGTPFLATTAVAGDNSFYGVIDVCESSVEGVSTAIVNTDVPLSSVFSYFHVSSANDDLCYDPSTREQLDVNSAECSVRSETTAETAFEATDDTEFLPSVQGGSGEVQVTLQWTSGDDLDLFVTDPNGASVSWMAPVGPSGGTLDLDNRGSDCRTRSNRTENIFWKENAPRGAYSVEVRNHKACSTVAEARLQVRVAGKVVIDQVLRVGEDGPISFDVTEASLQSSLLPTNGKGTTSRDGLAELRELRLLAAEWRKPIDLGPLSEAPSDPRRLLVAARGTKTKMVDVMEQYSEVDKKRRFEYSPIPNVKCSGALDGRFGLSPVFRPKFKHDMTIKAVSAKWDVEAGIQAGVSPVFEFSGEAGCELDVDGFTFQLTVNPIPINLELKPDISVTASGAVKLNGPALTVTLGVASKGSFEAKAEWCSGLWGIPYPCVATPFKQTTKPIADFNVGKATATIEGALNLAIGVQANIGIGAKNTLATAKGGFSFRMFPVAAELKAVAGTSNCVAGALGGRLAVDLLLEAYLLGLGGEYRRNLYDSNVIAYPGAKFEVGNCPDD